MLLNVWRGYYNEKHPHSSLSYRAPLRWIAQANGESGEVGVVEMEGARTQGHAIPCLHGIDQISNGKEGPAGIVSRGAGSLNLLPFQTEQRKGLAQCASLTSQTKEKIYRGTMKTDFSIKCGLQVLLVLSLHTACTSSPLEVMESRGRSYRGSSSRAFDPYIYQGAKNLMLLRKRNEKLEKAVSSFCSEGRRKGSKYIEDFANRILANYYEGRINELDYGLHSRNDHIHHVLIVAITKSSTPSFVQALLNAGADVKIADDPKLNTYYPLNHLVMDNKYMSDDDKLKMLKCLVARGLDINRQDVVGDTLLHKHEYMDSFPKLFMAFPQIKESLRKKNQEGKLPQELFLSHMEGQGGRFTP